MEAVDDRAFALTPRSSDSVRTLGMEPRSPAHGNGNGTGNGTGNGSGAPGPTGLVRGGSRLPADAVFGRRRQQSNVVVPLGGGRRAHDDSKQPASGKIVAGKLDTKQPSGVLPGVASNVDIAI